MTRDKKNRELVNQVKIVNGSRYYNAEELDQLADLGIEAYEVVWNCGRMQLDEKNEREKHQIR